ncbi:tRNA (guanosine(37)-N1)-methyltransferase TrmD [Magnetovibrio sp.]|uniref:tRNA (guanosine(37)-N1)-methyltransferase TrmD n=1 Tax=Magnetovibrio sp. TaxID=2024836 RepID=UPI002F934E94
MSDGATSKAHSGSPWQAVALTLFPDMFPGSLGQSLAGQALEDGRWTLETVDIRGFARDKHRTVDDTPCGGGAGMVMRPDIVDLAIRDVQDKTGGKLPLIYMTPRGRPLTQNRVRELAFGPGVAVLCGRYEGVDQRVLDAHDVEEISIGDYVLSGGEVAALVLMDACVRLIPGVMGSGRSHEEESFEEGLLEYPLYTRPTEWQGRTVPEVLLSGHHGNIRAWRREQAEAVTKDRRPDLWKAYKAASE